MFSKSYIKNRHRRAFVRHDGVGFSFFPERLFAGIDCVVGANRCAGTAVNAGIGIDYIDCAFGDSFNGAFGQTGAASHTAVSDYVSHG